LDLFPAAQRDTGVHHKLAPGLTAGSSRIIRSHTNECIK
jgi:hypothetical protein